MSNTKIQEMKKSEKTKNSAHDKLNNEISIEDKKRVSKLFFYLQDCSIELQAARAIMQIVKSTLNSEDKNGVTLTELDQAFTVKIVKHNFQTVTAMGKVSLHTAIINVCRITEAISDKQTNALLKKYCPISYNRLVKFKKLNYTPSITKYRNKYSAHPINKDTKDFLSLSEIHLLVSKILKIKNLKEMNVDVVFSFINTFHQLEEDSENIVTWIINEMSAELKRNGVDVDSLKR